MNRSHHSGDESHAIITPYKDGPILVRGAFKLVDQEGETITTHRKTVALCRCGRSSIRPFCDGTHKRIGFKAPAGDARVVGQPVPEAPAEG
ncbi:MAG: CDGSH iron-sulfur domain-containing protein [Actinomycetota bacterium]|nr:CDGSH iron-sulfur domain-containing protein [Actinomycetota bacterium]